MSACRGCGKELDPRRAFCDLGAQPLANALLTQADLSKPEVHYPLRPLVCSRCLLVQLPDTPEPEHIFTESYPFFSGQSHTWLQHCNDLADQVTKRFGLNGQSRVLEIGSNDGSMLRPFRGRGIPCIGVEPCAGVAQHALMEGLPTVIDWWTPECAQRLLHTDGSPAGHSWRADLVIATNVLAHVSDLLGFLVGVREILAPEGVAVFEVPYVKDLVQTCQFDQIYAEHHCYFSLDSLGQALEHVGLYPFDAELLPVHGGSIRVYARHEGSNPLKLRGTERATLLYRAEQEAGFHEEHVYRDFAQEPPKAKQHAMLMLAEHSDKRIVGYGASAKAAVTLNYFGLGPEWIEFVADTTPVKQGKYLPGCRIPVVHPDQLAAADPDVVLLLAWNWANEAMPKIRAACPRAEIISFHSGSPAVRSQEVTTT